MTSSLTGCNCSMRPEEVERNDDLFPNPLCGESPFKSIFSRWNENAMQNISLSVHNSTIAQLSGIFLPLPLLLKYWIDLAMMDRLCPIHIYIYIYSGFSGFATDCLCSVWCRGLTTCLTYACRLMKYSVKWQLVRKFGIMENAYCCFSLHIYPTLFRYYLLIRKCHLYSFWRNFSFTLFYISCRVQSTTFISLHGINVVVTLPKWNPPYL